ncbi:transposase [Pseudoxanthomonas sp. Root65]|uniref:REP-associated tyrosine transposase n=1 Tax=Pseudoxanthomonas sp. Root65 TaxID=1736576 RepID=UPI0006FADB6A|nr:transposase [Pseudoxanthomonas sp. Root65]KRA51256.1 transposase [Pseudoxanthomonas sp. Root65]
MTNYRRTFIPGATYFFTVNLADRRTTLLVDHIDLLRDAIRYTRHRHPFDIDAMVVLPDHLHALWTLPPNDADFPLRWRLIKTWFSRHLLRGEHRRASRVDKGERGIWQRRYWEHLIRDDVDFARHVDYIHWNPVKHGRAARVVDWPYSTFHRFVRDGVLAEGWGWDGDEAGFGERR